MKMEPSALERANAIDTKYKHVYRVADAIEQAYQDGIAAIQNRLRNPNDEFVETFSRLHHSNAWKKVDDNIADDDWNGGTALNMRSTLLRDAKVALSAIADAIDRDTPT